MGDVAGAPVPLANLVLASGMRGGRVGDDGLAGRPISPQHGVSKRTGSGTGDGGAWSGTWTMKNNRCLNAFGFWTEKKTLYNNRLVISTTCVSNRITISRLENL